MRFLFLPLTGAFLIIGLVILGIKIFALVDACTHSDAVYRAAGKLNKTAWVVILVVALLLNIIGLIAALVYLLDVRPALRQLRGGRGGGSGGPYGGW